MPEERPRSTRGRRSLSAPKTLPLDLYDYDKDPPPRRRVVRETPLLGSDGQALRVTDDWPDDIPVTEAEIEVFERWFGDVFEELLNPPKPKIILPSLSVDDKDKS